MRLLGVGPTTVAAIAGNKSVLYCIDYNASLPEAFISWKKRDSLNRLIPVSIDYIRIFKLNNGSLFFIEVIDDRGTYTCIVDNCILMSYITFQYYVEVSSVGKRY